MRAHEHRHLHHVHGQRLHLQPARSTSGCSSPRGAIAAVGFFLISHPAGTRRRSGCRSCSCSSGFGIGFGMQILTWWCKTEFPHAMVGAYDGHHNFFSEIGSVRGRRSSADPVHLAPDLRFPPRCRPPATSPWPYHPRPSWTSCPPPPRPSSPRATPTRSCPCFLWFVPMVAVTVVMMALVEAAPLATAISHGGTVRRDDQLEQAGH